MAGIRGGGRRKGQLSPARIMERVTGGKKMAETMIRTGSDWRRWQQ